MGAIIMLEQFNLILNLVFIVIVLLSALMGFLRGMRKSIFQLVMSLIFLILAVILIPYIATALLDTNIENYKQYFPAEMQEHVTTIKGTVASYLRSALPEQQFLFEEGSETLEIVYGVIKLVLVLLLYVVYFIISMTILKLITFIVWLFIRPKEEYPKRRPIGLLVGAVRGLLFVCLLAIPLAGVASMYGSVKTVMNANAQVETGNQMSGLGEYENIITAYDDTLVGKTFDVTNFDEVMFDYVFKIDIKVNGKKESVKIRNNIYHGAKIYETVMKATGGKLDETALVKISNDDLEEIKKHLEKTDILKLVQVVAVEYLYGEIENRNLAVDYEEHLTIENLKAIDLKKDIITLFNIVQIINEVEFTGENIEEKVFSLERETVEELFNEVAEIELLEYLLPMAINLALNSNDFKDIIANYGISEDEIVKPSPEELIEDIKNIKEVYLFLKDNDVNSLDEAGELFKDGAFLDLEDEELERFVGVIFDFEIINSNMPLIAAFGHNALEQQEDLKGLISRDEFLENFDEEEIKLVLRLVKVLVINNALNDEVDLETLLTEENIDKVSDIMVNSKIISLFTPKVLDMLFKNVSDFVELEVPDDISYKGEEGKVELEALLHALKTLYKNDFLSSSFDPSTITEEQVLEIAQSLSATITIKHNITAIVQKLINDQEADSITVKNYERDHWTSDEIFYTLMTMKLLSEYDLLTSSNDIKSLTNDQIDELAHNMSLSLTIKDNITPLIDQVVTNLGFDEITIDYPSSHWTEIEISSTVKGLKSIEDFGLLSSPFDISTLTDDRIEILSTDLSLSNTIRDSITPMIKNVMSDQGSKAVIQDYPGSHWTKSEIYHTLRSFRIVTAEDILLDNNSDILAHSMSRSVTVNSITKDLLEEAIEDYDYEIEIVVLENEEYAGEAGELELRSLFRAIKSINNHCLLDPTFEVAVLEDEHIDGISTDLSSSKTIRINLNAVVNNMVGGEGYDFIEPNYDESHWSKDEIYYTISAFKLFDVNVITSETIHTLPDQDIHTIARSKTISDGFKSEVYRMNENTEENTSHLKGKLVIPEGLVWESTAENMGEVEKVLLSIKLIQGDMNFSDFDPNIDNLFGKDKQLLFRSKVILHTFVDNHLKPLINDEDKLAKYFEPKDYYGQEYRWYDDENNDAVSFVEALDDLYAADIDYKFMDFYVFKNALKSGPEKPREINDAMVQSRIFTHSLTKMFKELLYNQGGVSPLLIPVYEGDPDEWGTPTQDGKLLVLLEQIAMLP